ncbi:MAG: dephospho-CoA kinase [Faecalibacterium sp.]
MITLGITGRSGCGKSTVTAVFAAHGVPLVDADQISREILLPGSPLLPQLAAHFGSDILDAEGRLNRRLLADRAFATAEGKQTLDDLTHPEIIRRIRKAKDAARLSGSPLFVLDGAVIVGTEAHAECDRLAVVTAPFETSVARIARRDGIAPEMAVRRLNAQTPEAVLTEKADYILCNDQDLETLQTAAAALCARLLKEASGKGGTGVHP